MHRAALALVFAVLTVGLLSTGCGGLETPPPPTVTRVPSATPTVEVADQQVATTTPLPQTGAVAPTATPPVLPTATLTSVPTATPFPPPTATSTQALPQAVVREGPLNVRTGPGTSYPGLGQLEAGTTVAITGQNEEGTWWQIDYESGAEGAAWVSAEYIQTSADVEAEAVEAPPVPATSVPAFAGKIVFQETSGGRIFIINANGTGLLQLSQGLDPALSPDGTKVAFTRWTVPAGIYLINVDGTQERLLTEVQQGKSPEWSLDGKAIAFTHRSGGDFDFYWDSEEGIVIKVEDQHWKIGVADVATGEFHDVHSEAHSFSPSWSNDGWWLVYDGEKGLMLTDATGDSTRWQQVSYGFSRDMSPDWSPAPGSDAWGAPIAFMVFHNDHHEIHTILPNGQGQARLTASPMFEAAQNSVAPEWSPDGRWIAFLTDRRGTWEVWVMRADGSEQRPLFRPGVLEGIEFHYEAQSEQVLDWGP
jgi:TolB protein